MAFSSSFGQERAPGSGVTAVLGPTNTGKTHLAIERMLAHSSGVIGLPLRLLAREVYNKVADRAGKDAVALITGEEKIKPPNPRYWVSTVEAMPRDLDVAFLAVDEVQLGADFERGHVFTDRMLNARAREETLVLGAATIRPMVEKLLPGAHVISRPRLSTLTYAGEKKLTRLPSRSAIVAFSADEVYAIAELIRRQRGGAAVVLGALSPRTRNAQVALYQSGDVDYLVATDAIGMGLNLDVDHVAFASDRKFDGYQFRKLNPAALAAQHATGRSVPPAAVIRSSPNWCRRWKATPSSRSGCCNGATPTSILPRSAPCRPRSQHRRMNRGSREHRSARIFWSWNMPRATRTCAHWQRTGQQSPVYGMPVRFLTIGKSHPRRMLK